MAKDCDKDKETKKAIEDFVDRHKNRMTDDERKAIRDIVDRLIERDKENGDL